MFHVNSWLLLLLFSDERFLAVVGDVSLADGLLRPYCNQNPFQWKIEPLSESDSAKVSSLRQIQAFFRHGARVSAGNTLTDIFANSSKAASELAFDCGVQTVETRLLPAKSQVANAYYIGADSQSSQLRVSLSKVFLSGEQLLEGNCADGQSIAALFTQQRANGQHIADAYLATDSGSAVPRHALWSAREYAAVRQAVADGSETGQFLELISTNKERTMASLAAVIQSVLNLTAVNGLSNVNVIPVHTHDTGFDPLRAYDIDGCGFKEWFFRNSERSSAECQSLLKSQLYKRTEAQWKLEIGASASFYPKLGVKLYSPLCAGLTLPISAQLLADATNVSDLYHACVFENSGNFSLNASLLEMGPLAKEILKRLPLNAGSDAPRMVLHSAHDHSLQFLYTGLRLEWGGTFPMYAELVILEVYDSDSGQQYFRWLRNGQWLPSLFTECQAAYARNGGSQLCPLWVFTDYLTRIQSPMADYLLKCKQRVREDSSDTLAAIGDNNSQFSVGIVMVAFAVGVCVGVLLFAASRQLTLCIQLLVSTNSASVPKRKSQLSEWVAANEENSDSEMQLMLP